MLGTRLPLAAILLLASGGHAVAVTYEATPSSDRARSFATVGRNCGNEAQRFCAASSTGRLQPHNMAICLKPYMSSLSFGCRAALRGTAQSPGPGPGQ